MRLHSLSWHIPLTEEYFERDIYVKGFHLAANTEPYGKYNNPYVRWKRAVL